jgi:hypothetical protein
LRSNYYEEEEADGDKKQKAVESKEVGVEPGFDDVVVFDDLEDTPVKPSKAAGKKQKNENTW